MKANRPWATDPDAFADSFRREVQADAARFRAAQVAPNKRTPKTTRLNPKCGRVWPRIVRDRCVRCLRMLSMYGREWGEPRPPKPPPGFPCRNPACSDRSAGPGHRCARCFREWTRNGREWAPREKA